MVIKPNLNGAMDFKKTQSVNPTEKNPTSGNNFAIELVEMYYEKMMRFVL